MTYWTQQKLRYWSLRSVCGQPQSACHQKQTNKVYSKVAHWNRKTSFIYVKENRTSVTPVHREAGEMWQARATPTHWVGTYTWCPITYQPRCSPSSLVKSQRLGDHHAEIQSERLSIVNKLKKTLLLKLLWFSIFASIPYGWKEKLFFLFAYWMKSLSLTLQ